MAWTKIVLADELLAGELPDDPYLDLDLKAYFPTQMREQFRDQIEAHPLRREIIVTQVVNDLVNGAGMSYWPRLADETGATVADLTRANFVSREIYASLPLRDELKSWDNKLDARVQTSMRIEMRTLVERASRWLVNNRRPPLDSQATVEQFAGPVQATMAQLPELMTGRELEAFQERQATYERRGVPEELARRVAVLPPAYMLLGIVEVAQREDLAPEGVARVHFALGERLGLPVLLQRIVALPREDKWQTMARAALRDDLHAVHTALTAQVLRSTSADDSAPARIAAWEEGETELVRRAAETLEQICAEEEGDLARMSVGLRVVAAAAAGLSRGSCYRRRRQAELVAFRVGEHHPGVRALGAAADLGRAQCEQPRPARPRWGRRCCGDRGGRGSSRSWAPARAGTASEAPGRCPPGG